MQKKILLVDDESSLRRTMTLGLSQAGYDTEPCENGIKALKKLETYIKNDVPLAGIVVDVHLPDINGLKLIKIMKFKYPGIPIVLITGFADKYNLEEIRTMDATVLLEKPFTPEELVETFAKLVEEKTAAEAKETKSTEESEASAYLLLSVDEAEGFIDAYKKLHVMKPVVYCDTTKGDYDIVMMVQMENKNEIIDLVENRIKQVKGVNSVVMLDVETPVLDESTHNILKDAEHVLDYFSAVSSKDTEGKVCAYLMMEVEKENQQDIYLNMKLNEDVVFCEYTSGKFNMISMVKADFFGDIDRLIRDKINPLNGVVKVKKYPIINLFEM